jgi:UDP-2,4-diacetamido-2,4,6-trideoxy-beta-L-altropyranose hydrolase
MTPLLLRYEATPALGTGHAMRCLALAQEWVRRGGRAIFAMGGSDAALSARLESSGMSVSVSHSVPGSAEDAAETAALARALGVCWVVVDGPMFGAAWDSAWPVELRLLRIDDNGLGRPFRADILLNQNLGASAGEYPAKPGSCRQLLGPEYALLRPEFLRMGVMGNGPARTGRIVVTLGGSDPACATERVLAALLQPSAQGVEAEFIIGAANPRRATLAAAIAVLEPRLQVVVAPADLAERFARAAFAVTAGGTTLYELALLRTPMLVLCTAENQRRTCERFAAAGAVLFAGWHADAGPEALAGMIVVLAGDAAGRAELAERAAGVVDGRGAARVVDAMTGDPL